MIRAVSIQNRNTAVNRTTDAFDSFSISFDPFCFGTSKRYQNTFQNTRKTSVGSERLRLRAPIQLQPEYFSLGNREQRVKMLLFAWNRSVRAALDTFDFDFIFFAFVRRVCLGAEKQKSNRLETTCRRISIFPEMCLCRISLCARAASRGC